MSEQPQDQSPSRSKVVVAKTRSSKRLLVVGVGVLVAGVAISVIWYLLWLNSPAYIVAQSFKNTLALDKTTYQLTYTDDNKIGGLSSVKVTGQYAKDKGSRGTADLVFKNSEYGLAITTDLVLDTRGGAYYQYKKVSNVPTNDPKKQMSDELLKQVLTAFGSRWSKLDSNMLQSGSSCAITALQKMQHDTGLGEKLVNALVGSGAVDITTVSSQGDMTVYGLKGKTDKVNAFFDAYTKTGIYTDLVKCSESTYKVTTDAIKEAIAQSDVEITVNKKAMHIENFAFVHKQNSSMSKLQLTVTPVDKVDVTIPTDVAALE